jgi:hypothetical protein
VLAGLIGLAALAGPSPGAVDRDPILQEQARPAPAEDEQPSGWDSEIAFGGGILALVLVGLGLTITIRSLLQDMRGRRHRYRRRTRREPRSS